MNNIRISPRIFLVLYREEAYGTWKQTRVNIPLDLDPKRDRLDFVKSQLENQNIDFARNQVKFGKLKIKTK